MEVERVHSSTQDVIIDWDPIILTKQAYRYWDARAKEEENAAKRIKMKEQAAEEGGDEDPMKVGVSRMEKIAFLLDHMPNPDKEGELMSFSDEQRAYANNVIRSFLPAIFESAWKTHSSLIEQRYGAKKSLIAFVAGRQAGKTTITVNLLVILFCVIKGLRILATGQSERNAKMILSRFKNVYNTLDKYYGGEFTGHLTHKHSSVTKVEKIGPRGFANKFDAVAPTDQVSYFFFFRGETRDTFVKISSLVRKTTLASLESERTRVTTSLWLQGELKLSTNISFATPQTERHETASLDGTSVIRERVHLPLQAQEARCSGEIQARERIAPSG